jgi:hypothetical protein
MSLGATRCIAEDEHHEPPDDREHRKAPNPVPAAGGE